LSAADTGAFIFYITGLDYFLTAKVCEEFPPSLDGFATFNFFISVVSLAYIVLISSVVSVDNFLNSVLVFSTDVDSD
jgi:hypothetical protein